MNASSLAITDLNITHPDRLRLALNYSTFLHDIADETDQACYIAKRAMDNAQAEVDCLETDVRPDSIRFIELLRKRIVSSLGLPSHMPDLSDFFLIRPNGSRLARLTLALTMVDPVVEIFFSC